ncbi:MAG: MFS transporter [Thermoprotei archaeon]|nr:MFS transporter [TACK group archaeon]
MEYKWTALSVTTVGAILGSMQGSALMIALPSMMRDLDLNFFFAMWIILIYMLLTVALVPMLGRFADIVGRKKLYNVGFAIFGLGSLLSGMTMGKGAVAGVELIAFRGIQAVGGSFLMVNSVAIVTDAFKKGEVGLGLGVNQVAGIAGFTTGPVVGGMLTAISWRWVFLFNIPIAIFAVPWAYFRLREVVEPLKNESFDFVGNVLLLTGLTLMLLGLTFIAFPGFPEIYTVFLLIGSLPFFALFVYVERRVKYPLIDFSLFRNRLFALGNISNLLNGIATGAVMFLLIFFLQGPYGQTPLSAGIMMIPFGLAFLAVGPVSGRLSDKWGSRILSTAGLGVTAIGLLFLATITKQTPYPYLAAYMAIMGAGGGLFESPNTNAVMTSVDPHKRGIASGVRTMLRNTGSMLSLAVSFPFLISRVSVNDLMQIMIYGGGVQDKAFNLSSFEYGLHLAFYFSLVISVVAMILSSFRPSHSPMAESRADQTNAR